VSDDIVTRLRHLYTVSSWGLRHEAADEIERLRAELAQAKQDLKQCANDLNAETWGEGL
jgi:hypothetical protein